MKLALVILAVSFVLVYGADFPKVSSAVYEIIDGDCDSALDRDEVFHEHVLKTRLPPISRQATSSWSGNQTIYCLKVLNDLDESKGATCEIISGGVGSTNVTIDMHSARNQPLEFDIHVYAK